jgi:hypothetical protein
MSRLICADNLVSCFCYEENGHEGLHICRCGGSWDKDKEPHTLPRGIFGEFPLTKWEEEVLKAKEVQSV